MDYDISALLHKLGINELATKKDLRWFYIDATEPNISGCAHARFANDGRMLVVDLHHHFKNTDEFDGEIGEMRAEAVTLHARRVGDGPLFRISKVSFDGMDYDCGDAAMVELCAGLFYARAMKINEIMLAQKYKKAAENWRSAEDHLLEKQAARKRLVAETVRMAEDVAGVIVPFRPRKDAPLQRI